MFIVKCTLLSNMSHFSGGGGGVIDGVGVGWGNIIKEKFMYDTSTSSMTSSTGLKPIQSCYDKGT